MSTPAPGPRTLAELQGVLSQEIAKLQAGEGTPATANAITGAVSTILRSVKLQMEYHRLTGRTPTIPLLDGKD